MTVTPIYATILGLLFIALSVRTIRMRRKHRVAVGDGNNSELRRAMRVHANFAEYVPLALLLIFFVELDGTPWVCCPRSFLKQALADLEREAGVSLVSSFEHEFQILDAGWRSAPAFALQALRRADPFGPSLMARLKTG